MSPPVTALHTVSSARCLTLQQRALDMIDDAAPKGDSIRAGKPGHVLANVPGQSCVLRTRAGGFAR